MKRLLVLLCILSAASFAFAGTMQTVPGGVWIPAPAMGTASTLSFGASTALTAASHKYAFIFQAPKAGAIHKVHFRTGTTTTDAASRLQATIETVDTTAGNPSGSAYGGSAAGTAAAAPGSATWETITLGTDATVVNVGDVIAAVIGYQTFTAADSVTIATVTATIGTSMTLPYNDLYGGASWTHSGAGVATFAIEYSDGTFAYIPFTLPVSAITNQSYASNTAGTDEYALSFQLPFPARLSGAAAMVQGAGDYEFILYTGTTATETLAVDKDQISTSSVVNTRTFVFTTPRLLAANTVYRLAVRPTTTTALALQIYTVNDAAILNQMAGGSNFRLATRIDQGAWDADTTTKRPAIFLRLDQFDDGVGGGKNSGSAY